MPAELFKTKSLHVKNKEGEYSDVWLTPPEILHSLGDFDLDPCASRERPWPTADKHLTIDDDGLSRELPIGGIADRMGFQLRRGLLAIVAQTYVLSIGVIASP